MKKLKYLLSVLVFALVLSGTFNVLNVKAADEPTLNEPKVKYADQYVEVGGDNLTDVYFQVTKSKEVTAVKANAWVPATAVTDADDVTTYRVDISSFTKGGFVAFATSATADKAEQVVEIVAPVKALKVTLDYAMEDGIADLYDVLATISVTPLTGSATSYDVHSTDATISKLKTVTDVYALQWKRGANGVWTDADKGNFATDYAMLRSSNGTLYVRVSEAKVGDAAKAAVLPSKEVKVKVAKTASAPAIKVDYAKGTLSIKTGMEIFYEAKSKNIVLYAAQKDASATATAVLSADQKAATKKGVSTVTVNQLVDAINAEIKDAEAKIGDAAKFTIKVRTSATAKKYASWYTELTLTTGIAKPAEATKDAGVGTYVYDAYNKTLTINLTAKTEDGRKLEYAIAGSDADVSTLKFTEVADATKPIDLSKNLGKAIKYVATTGTKNETLKFEGIGKDAAPTATVYLRWKAVVDKTTPAKNAFASKCVDIACTAATTFKVNFVDEKPDNITAFTVKDAADRNYVGTGVEVSDGSKVEFLITVTPASGYEVTKVMVTIGETPTEATYNSSKKAYVFTIDKVVKDTACTLECTTKSTSTGS